MTPNTLESNLNTESKEDINNLKQGSKDPLEAVENTESNALKIFQSSLNLLAHILIGFVVGVSLLLTFNNGLPVGAIMLHVSLCVLGYQLLMGQAILCLCPNSGWSDRLRLKDKRRIHTILQIMGSVLGIAGSVIAANHRRVNWTTLHGKFGLVAMVFTTVSLVNGLTSLYAHEFRKFLPGRLSKITHILFGTIAFVASGIALCYGFDKHRFKQWAGPGFAYTLIAFTACLTFIIIINPCITFFNKTLRVFK